MKTPNEVAHGVCTLDAPNVRLWDITPVVAERCLLRSRPNRGIRGRHLQTLTAEMRAGRWQVNGETLVFDEEGYLIDGRHRLRACIASGVPFRSYVVLGGVDENSMLSIDSGQSRNPGESLIFYGVPNHNHIAAMARWIHRYRTRNMTYEKTILSRYELREMVEKHPEMQWSFMPGKRLYKLAPPSLSSAMHFLMAEKDRQLADAFFDAVASTHVEVEYPMAHTLRETLFANRLRNAKLPAYHLAALMIKAWNFTRAGKSTKQLQWYPGRINRPEPFPEIK